MSSWTPSWTASTGVGELKPLYVRVFDYPRGYHGNLHSHRFAQLVYSVRGAANVYSERGQWVVSPFQAVMIPSWQPHRVGAEGNALLHSLFIDPNVYPNVMGEFGILPVSSLLHELLQSAGVYFADYASQSLEHRLLELAVELINRCEPDVRELCLPVIKHQRIHNAIVERQQENSVLRSADIAKRAALSPRQFARVFKADVGMTFKDWRALYQTQQGIALLHQGLSVTEVAIQLGFSSASAFITVFRKLAGSTPKSFKS